MLKANGYSGELSSTEGNVSWWQSRNEMKEYHYQLFKTGLLQEQLLYPVAGKHIAILRTWL